MKKCTAGGEHFVVSAFRLTKIPIRREDGAEAAERASLAQKLCEDAFELSSGGGSLDLVRRDDHAAAGHTGGNALWGKSV